MVTSAPRALFFTSASQRVALARQSYFEEGQLPSGSINRSVLDSWSRCRRLSLQPHDSLDFSQTSSSRTHLALQRNRPLIEAWREELTDIERTLSGTCCSAILTDPTGVLIATTGQGGTDAVIIPQAHRVGVNLSEECVGTTAPGLVLKTGQAATVLGGEHYFERALPMHCAAAPIHNTQGQLAGVLDISSEGMPFDFDIAALVGLYATSIENRLLTTQANEHLVLRLQVSPALLDTPMVGLAGIDGRGRVAWMNSAASSLLGKSISGLRDSALGVEEVFGTSLHLLLSLPRDKAMPIRLANGLSVWIRGQLQAHDGIDALAPRIQVAATGPTVAEAVSSPVEFTPVQPAASDTAAAREAPSLRESDTDLILRTVRLCDGNISKAAKQLQVSRGLIYRRLKNET